MLRSILVAAIFAVTTGVAHAGNTFGPIDYYMISRGDDGLFLGSHKIFLRAADGLTQVKYCGRSYWVRPVTVAWTQVEMDNAHEVRVEFNRGKGWRPICERPTDYVTLEDLGVSMDPYIVVRTEGDDLTRVNKWQAVSKSLKRGDTTRRGSTTYHSN
jgi:hypothetical protein